MASLPRIDPELVLQHKFSDLIYEYTEKEVALYALGVGVPGHNPIDPVELDFVYHADGQASVKVLPTFAVLYPSTLLSSLGSITGLRYDAKLLLHGEQYAEIYGPLPTRGKIRSTARVAGLHDKGKAAIVEVEIFSYDANTGKLLCMNRSSLFLRGAGGFSPSSKPYSFSSRTTNFQNSNPKVVFPEAAPDFVYEDQTSSSQALLYRLSGDYNKIHSDPKIASQAGFPRPILHGLCTLGFAVRAITRKTCNGDPTKIQSFQGRFLSYVFPGEKLTTEIWVDTPQSRVLYKTTANGRSVLSGHVSLTCTPTSRL